MRKILSICLLLIAVVAQAQIQEPVKFKSELKTLAAGEAEIVFTATIDKGWHVYSTDLGDGGPISATFNVEDFRCYSCRKVAAERKRNSFL